MVGNFGNGLTAYFLYEFDMSEAECFKVYVIILFIIHLAFPVCRKSIFGVLC